MLLSAAAGCVAANNRLAINTHPATARSIRPRDMEPDIFSLLLPWLGSLPRASSFGALVKPILGCGDEEMRAKSYAPHGQSLLRDAVVSPLVRTFLSTAPGPPQCVAKPGFAHFRLWRRGGDRAAQR